MATEIANAYVALYARMPGVGKDIQQALGGAEASRAVEKSGSGIGSKLSSAAGKVFKAGLIAVGATAAAGLGAALVKGFGRLQALDQATAKLDGLGHSAETVDQIMSDALASVRGTAFGMDAAATAAANAVAAGIAPGQDLERTLKLVADAATIAGTDMGSMGAIFNKVAASNKVQMDVINQLHDAGVPALALLASQMGVTAEEASKMASQGKIDFATFQAAMEQGLGGAAQASGDTFSGAMANVMAALGRVGANLLSGIFPYLAPLMSAIQTALGPLEDRAKDIGGAIGNFIGPALQWLTDTLNGGFDLSGFLDLASSLSPVGLAFKALQPMLPTLVGAFQELGGVLAGALSGALQTVIPVALQLVELFAGMVVDLLPSLLPLFAQIVTVVGTLFAAIVPLVSTLLSGLVPVFAALIPVVMQVIEAILPLVMMLIEAFAPILGVLIEALMPIIDAFLQLLPPILSLLSPLIELIGAILEPLIALITGPLLQAALIPLTMAFTTLLPPIMEVVKGLATALIPIIEAVMRILGGLIDFLVGVFTGDWEKAWQGIQDIFGGIWDALVGIVKGVLNTVIGVINGILSGINGVAGAISDATGGAVNFSIPMIPKLAEGAVINARPGGVIANVGEGRYPEAVLPLEGPQMQRVGEAVAEASGGVGPQDLSDSTIEKLADAIAQRNRLQLRQGVMV